MLGVSAFYKESAMLNAQYEGLTLAGKAMCSFECIMLLWTVEALYDAGFVEQIFRVSRVPAKVMSHNVWKNEHERRDGNETLQ